MSRMIHPFHPQKLLWHRDRIELMQRGIQTPGPVSLEWDLSNTCPHDCPFCSFGTSESQGYRQQHWHHFPSARAFALVPELVAAGVRSVTLTGGGEPLMHPDAAKIMRALIDAKMPWGLVTNGYLLTGAVAELVASHARFVRVSLDAGTDLTHRLVHRPKTSQFEAILANLSKVTGRNATVGASFCVMDANYHEIETCAERLIAIGANYLEVRPTYPTEWRGDGWPIALTETDAAREALERARIQSEHVGFQVLGLIDRFDALKDPAKGYERCQIGPLTSVLGADGRLWHCCIQRGQDAFALGSVLDKTFAEAWKAAQEKHLANAIDVGKCPRCRYDNYNRLLKGLDERALHEEFV